MIFFTPKRILLIAYVVLLGAIIFMQGGCYTQSKAVKLANKALDKFPDTTGKIFRNKYPCVTTGEKVTVDSSAYKEWQDDRRKADSVWASLLGNIQPEIIHDTIAVTDSANCNKLKEAYKRNEKVYLNKIGVLNTVISNLQDQLNKVPAVVKNVEKEKEDSNKIAEKDRQLAAKDAENIKANSRIKELEAQNDKLRSQRNWLFLIICAALVALFRRQLWGLVKKIPIGV